MSQRFRFSLKGLLLATAMFAVVAWMASLVWPSQPPTPLKLVVTPMLCLILFRLWVLSRN